MAASTASMCLRRESLSVHVHISSHDCSRFNCLLSVDRLQVSGFGLLWAEHSAVPGTLTHFATCVPSSSERRGPEHSLMPVAWHLLTFIRDSYDAAWRVRLLDGSGRFASDQDDLEVAGAPIPFLDAARELSPFQVEHEALGDLAAQHATLFSHRAEAGERGLGVPFQPDHDIRLTAGVVAEGDFRRRRFPCDLQSGGGSGRGLFCELRLLLGRVVVSGGIPGLIGAGPEEEQHSEEHHRRRHHSTNSFGLKGTHEHPFYLTGPSPSPVQDNSRDRDLALDRTESSISGVSTPVKVLCCDGW